MTELTRHAARLDVREDSPDVMAMEADRDAEYAVLDCAMQSPLARKTARMSLTSNDFYWPEHATIWEAMRRLDHAKDPVNFVTVQACVQGDRQAMALMPNLVTPYALPDQIEVHVRIVKAWSVRRAMRDAAVVVRQRALDPNMDPVGFAAKAVTQFTRIRDMHAVEDVTAKTLGEMMATPDEPPEWIIPGLLERGDRLILTGEEGAGKSHLMRQLAMFPAASLHPFDMTPIAPVRTLILDAENSERQAKRRMRGMYQFVCERGSMPDDNVILDNIDRIDITRDADLNRIHQLLDAMQPDMLLIGPLYKITPGTNDDKEAAPVLAALDTIHERGITLIIEHHAGHGTGSGGHRDMRPIGSSALRRWPEFGYGLRSTDDGTGLFQMTAWRGDRDAREWPTHVRRGSGDRWIVEDVLGQAGGF